MLSMVLKSAVRADFREELSSAWLLPLECVEAGEWRGHFKWFRARCLFGDGPEVRAAGWNGSLEGKPGRMGYRWSLENLEFPVQSFKTYPRSNKKLWSFGSRLERNYGWSWQFYGGKGPIRNWSRGFPTVFHRRPKALKNLLGHQGGADWRRGGAGILASPNSTRELPFFVCLFLFDVDLRLLCKVLLEERSPWD